MPKGAKIDDFLLSSGMELQQVFEFFYLHAIASCGSLWHYWHTC